MIALTCLWLLAILGSSFRAENCTLRQFFDGESIRLILFLLKHTTFLKLLIQDGD
ncbi:MAG: hypothetical protein IPP22_05245 [Nitrosomonas sp.]|nr:hypothetical protein [Nitrosomonas sp.]